MIAERSGRISRGLATGVLALAMAWSPASRAGAEVADRSPEQLRQEATVVVTGEIASIDSTTELAGDFEVTNSFAEISVTELEKGEGVEAGDRIRCHFWRRTWIGKGPPQATGYGHRGVPPPGSRVRAYLSGSGENGYEVLSPNGIEKLDGVDVPGGGNRRTSGEGLR